MGIVERRDREKGKRESSIVAAARRIAEREGWGSVTIRRLASEIEYSQPVLYSHFSGREAIVAAVALDGFREMALLLRGAAGTTNDRAAAIGQAANAYLSFARASPATYEAMFSLPTTLIFADADTRHDLRSAFEALAAVLRPTSVDRELATETAWAALHGLAELDRSGRIRKSVHGDRVAAFVRMTLAL